MLAKRPAPVIGKFSNPIMTGNIWDASTSPRSPSEFKILSPRGPINYDLGGVGLGIVAALEKYADGKCQVPVNKPFCSRNSSRSDPIPVNSTKSSSANKGGLEEDDSLEYYTFVRRRGPDNKTSAIVYNEGDFRRVSHQKQKDADDWRRSKRNQTSLFSVSPARFGDFPSCPADDFLSCCHMCQKKLHGKDIFMYRGEKAFCSPECRYRQIVMDEKKERHCSAELASRSVEISSSPCNNERIFSPGILAS